MTQKWIVAISKISLRYPKVVLLFVALMTLFLGYHALSVGFEADVQDLIPEDEEISLLFEKYGEGFERGDYQMIAFRGDYYDQASLSQLAIVVEQLEALSAAKGLVTPFNLFTFKRTGAQVLPISMAPGGHVPVTPEDIRIFRDNLENDRFIRDFIVSRNSEAIVFLLLTSHEVETRELIKELEEILEPISNAFDYYIAGALPFDAAAFDFVTKDFSFLILISAVLMIILFYLGFRSLFAVFLPTMIIIISSIWTLGFMSLTGLSLTLVSIIAPPLVITLGSSYSIHQLNHYYRSEISRLSTIESKSQVFSIISRTIVLAAGTTMIGFSSLLVTSLDQSREFGIAVTFGIFSAALLSLTFLPASLLLFPSKEGRKAKKIRRGLVNRILLHVANQVTRRGKVFRIIAVLIIIIAPLSFSYLRIQTNYFGYFPEESKTMIDFGYIGEEFGGIDHYYLSITAPDEEPGFFLEPENLVQLWALEDELKSNSNITFLGSFSSFLRHFSPDPEQMTVPSKALISLFSRYLLIGSGQGGAENPLKLLATEDYSRITIMTRVRGAQPKQGMSQVEQRAVMDFFNTTASETIPESWSAEVWGYALRFLSLFGVIQKDQLISAFTAVLFIFILTSLAFRSVKTGVLALIPMISGILINYLLMAFTGFPLDMTTLMVGSIAVGIGVDDSIHFLLQYRIQSERFPSQHARILRQTIIVAGRPILLTGVSIISGMGVLIFASFPPITYFGFLVGAAILFTKIGCLIFLPAFINTRYRNQRK